MISQKLLQELKEILDHDYKLKPTMQEVLEIATTLLGYVETLIKIDSKISQAKGGESQ